VASGLGTSVPVRPAVQGFYLYQNPGLNMNQSFRQWLTELWRENCDELDGYRQPRHTFEEYFTRYKWWLKREYQYQRTARRLS
jgi:hypothetical protein